MKPVNIDNINRDMLFHKATNDAFNKDVKTNHKFLKYLIKALPPMTVRRIVLGSIIGLIYQKNKEIPLCLLDKINNILKFSREVKSIKFPVYMYGFVWNQKNIINEKVQCPDRDVCLRDILFKRLKDNELNCLAVFLYEKLDCIFHYGKKKLIVSDIYTLLNNLNDFSIHL